MKIFFLVSRVPYPIEKGDKLRAFYQIKHLYKKGHEIILCALGDKAVHPDAEKMLSQYCSKVIIYKLSRIQILFRLFFTYIFSNKSLQVSYFYNKHIHKNINKLIEKYQPEHIFCQLVRVSEYVKHLPLPKTLDYMDALSRGMERQIEKAPFYLKPFIKVEAIRLKRYEHQIFDYFTNHCIISEQDKKLITHIRFEEITVIPNGIDFNRFQFEQVQEKKYDVLFTGNMSYPPNIDAALFLINKIMPIVWKQKPQAVLMISGASPARDLLKHKSTKNIIISGWVDDLSAIYKQSRIFVAPMHIGTGLQNKLLEAMAMQLPCVTSTLANNALQAENGKSVIIAETVEAYANNILKLLENEKLQITIGEGGYHYVKNNFSWEKSVNELEKLFDKKNGQ